MMDEADRELFERSLAHATTAATGADLDAALGELGWAEALADDPRPAVSALFEQLGRSGATCSALGWVLADALGLALDHDLAVVLPAFETTDPPGRADGEAVVVGGLVAGGSRSGWAEAEGALVVTGRRALTVPTDALAAHPVHGVDPDLGLVQVTGDLAGPELPADLEVLAELDPEAWTRAVGRAQVAVGHQLVGASRRMLELAREHALDRVQFGRTISQFQAVRHRLAEALVAIESADALLDAAWLEPTPVNAALAKGLAGRQARVAVRHCQQVLAGIGFTTEHDLHRFIRRVLVLDGLFGGGGQLTASVGRELLAARALPPLVRL